MVNLSRSEFQNTSFALVVGGPYCPPQVMVGSSNFTAAKILDKRPSPSGVEYRCELKPLWFTADLVEKALSTKGRCEDRMF